MVEWLARWWAHRRLHRGRCAECDAVLRDDTLGDYCSPDCELIGWAWNF